MCLRIMKILHESTKLQFHAISITTYEKIFPLYTYITQHEYINLLRSI